jgi:glycosyltransferase involved in cell wall biosynthesis
MTLQRNVGIDAAGGEVVVFIDDDCTIEPGLFEVLTTAYTDPSVVGATGRIEAASRNRLGNNPHSRLRWLLLGGGRQGTMSSFGFRCPIVDVEQPRDVEFMPGAFMSARRDVAAQVRFDEGSLATAWARTMTSPIACRGGGESATGRRRASITRSSASAIPTDGS